MTLRARGAVLLVPAAVLTVLAVLAPAVPAAAAAAPPTQNAQKAALKALQECTAGLDSLDIGYERIAERCPELAAALDAGAFAPWLPADWKRPGNELSAAGLTQLQRLLTQALATQAPAHAPDPRHLATVLARLPPLEQRPSWHERLTGWLHGRAPPQPGGASTFEKAFAQWVGPLSLPAAAGYGLLAAVVLAAALLAARELRLVARRWPRGVRFPWRRTHAVRPAPPPAAAPADPGALLAGVAACLAPTLGVAPQGLTARELTRAAGLPPALLPPLAALAGVTERLRFAPVPPPEAEIAAVMAQGRQLLTQLQAGGRPP